MKIVLKQICLAVFVLSLSACGFHLRGQVSLPKNMNQVFISSKRPYANLVKQVQKTLQQRGIDVVEDQGEAKLIVEILNQEKLQSVNTVDNTNQPSQYTITYKVRYRIKDNQGNVLVAPITATSFGNQVASQSKYARNYQEKLLQQNVASQIANSLSSDAVVNSTTPKQ